MENFGNSTNSLARILIVEDDNLISATLRQLLENKGYEVVAMATTGQEAISLATTTNPDLIFMDIRLEGSMDGVEAVAKINELCNIPVIYLTAWDDEKTLERVKYTRPFGYILKPFRKEDIYRTIAVTLFKHRMETRLSEVEAKNLAILEALPDTILQVDRHAKVKTAKVAPKHVKYFQTSSFVGQSLTELSDTTNFPSFELRRAMMNLADQNDQELETFEFIIKEGGEPCYFEFRVMRLDPDEFLVIVSDNTVQKMLEAQIFNSVLEAQENERRRFAGDLHDGLGQILSSIKMKLEAYTEERDKGGSTAEVMLNQALQYLTDAIAETRNVSHNLMPSTLHEFGLQAAIREMVDRVHQENLAISFQSFDVDRRFHPNVEVTLYRATQELMNNILKHSEAAEVTIQLFFRDGTLYLSVEDDGKGMMPQELGEKDGIGIRNMRKRAEMLGGIFEFVSSPGKGTSVYLELPATEYVSEEVTQQQGV